MPKLELTAATVGALTPGAALVEYQDAKQPGLCLRVTPNGAKTWTVRYRLKNGERKRVSLGAYPALPVSIARTEAVKIIASVARGGDPAAEAQDERQAFQRVRLETVEAVGKLYFEKAAAGRHRMNGKPKRASSIKMERLYFDGMIVPALGKSRMASLTRAEVQMEIDRIEASRSGSSARHCRNVLQRIFAFALWQDIVSVDPTRFVSAPESKGRERVLNDQELRAIWRGLSSLPAHPTITVSLSMTLAIKLEAATLQRRSEVVGMRVEEIDRLAKLWTIPGTRTKNHRTHVVPLSDLALALIDQAVAARGGRFRDSAFVFPSPRDAAKAVLPEALNTAWFRGLPTFLVDAPTSGEPQRQKQIGHATPHDLRRTGATNLTGERLRFPRFIVSQVLNHTSDTGNSAAVTAVYDRNTYIEEKRRALDAWAGLLLEIVEGRERPDNVVRMAS